MRLKNEIGVETHLFDFDEDIYGKNIVTNILHFMRPEIHFEGLDALMEQLRKDELTGKAYFGDASFDFTNIM